MIKKISVTTDEHEQLVDITFEIKQFVKESNILEGRITVFIPHTTAAVTINENADPDVQHDLIIALNKISPDLSEFRHMEGNSDAHTKSSIVGCSQDIIIHEGKLLLGTWQGVYFCEFDGPRTRTAILRIY
ncbi:MAG: YjbQ family protein [Candidatus Cloacimonetes bacterium]|jgi:secondary thiamine-phosphate synthase enzyme|nr:YjbQ family protein [Candidatus Cloacimonadota bacterium]MBT4333141.1 YjbQ family protein [Candidatus Cloacimonadota bacterium]MBT4575720.1 YjbQ family protein [Candidatus Cloacimonadota bacterium]MBT5419476.1 YjbQ family protein [Candidatus Cloacimonadota bacterium]